MSTAQPELLWTRSDWLAQAEALIREEVDVRGAIEQPHVYWWSTVLRVPTADGVVWLSVPQVERLCAELAAAGIPYGLKLFLKNGPIGTWQ